MPFCPLNGDFVNYKTKKIVEICGIGTPSFDSQRMAALLRSGWRVYRIPNEVVDLWMRRQKYRQLSHFAPGVVRRREKDEG